MKLIKTLLSLETQFLKITQNNEILAKSILPLGLIALAGEAIWLVGSRLSIAGYTPLESAEKKAYVIAALFLVWLLKFVLLDLETPTPLQYKDLKTRKKIQALENRFLGAMDFLKKTMLSKSKRHAPLHQTPWLLLLGPHLSGKTTLLANSAVPFILQKQFPNESLHHIPPSVNCDWWVMRDACIIDIPGKYITSQHKKEKQAYRILWHYFLKLALKYRGKNGINGLIIALPVMEILQQYNSEEYQLFLKDMFQRIYSLQQSFPQPIPCQIVLTKCDLIPGFKEFFSESSQDEIEQAWGIHLSTVKAGEKPIDQLTSRFNALIKKINQQLLWRLHHERNPMARPYIKDFPLQLEQVKDFLVDFCKRFHSAKLNVKLQSIHLTSAIQPKKEDASTVIEESIDDTTRTIQLFNDPLALSRPYFIKQLLQQGLAYQEAEPIHNLANSPWRRRLAYAASLSIISAAVVFLGRDFQAGLEHTYALQKDISDFQVRIAKMQDPVDHLIETITLLNTLKPESHSNPFNFNIRAFLTYYSNKSEQKGEEVYQAALHTILLPEVRNFFEEYFKNPLNKEADDLYAVLKAYLMLGDASHLNSSYIRTTVDKILPKTLMETENADLISHLDFALNAKSQPLTLNQDAIQETRKFLAALPKIKTAYIILKNVDDNNDLSASDIMNHQESLSAFTTQPSSPRIPIMFTASAFPRIVNQQLSLAAQQAVSGNWVLGHGRGFSPNPLLAKTLADRLRTTYLNSYIDTWESLLANTSLIRAGNLIELDTILLSLISSPSPLTQLLQTIHENTSFEPILSLSPRLQALNELANATPSSQKQLADIFESIRSLHLYLQPALETDNTQQAAFNIMTNRMLGRGNSDVITQARIAANQSPEPIKTWLTNMANAVSNMLMVESGRYIDTSWQNEVMPLYQTEIANRYPFNATDGKEVDIEKFKRFFGNPGVLISYFNNYLKPFVDTSTAEWRWKSFDNKPLPFSDDTLRQLQLAMRIHRSFFPNNDDKLHVQFSLQPYELGKLVKTVTLKINDKQVIDNKDSMNNTHVFSWPSLNTSDDTSIKLTLNDNQRFNQEYAGHWGWFKLISQSFESVVSKKELLLNLSTNEHAAKYLLFTDGKYNPFSSLDLKHFHLPHQLTDEQV